MKPFPKLIIFLLSAIVFVLCSKYYVSHKPVDLNYTLLVLFFSAVSGLICGGIIIQLIAYWAGHHDHHHSEKKRALEGTPVRIQPNNPVSPTEPKKHMSAPKNRVWDSKLGWVEKK